MPIFAFLLLFFTASLWAQDCADKKCFQKGTKLTFENFKAGKSLGKETQEVVSASKLANGNLEAVLMTNEEGTSYSYKIICNTTSILIDLQGLMDQEMMKNFAPGNKIEAKVVSSENMEFPYKAEVGADLKPAMLKLKIYYQGNEIGTVQALLKNRKVELKDTLVNAAGSFETLKMTSEVELTTTMFGQTKKQNSRSAFWINPSVGLVKVINYSAAGKEENSRVLVKVE